MKLEIDEGSPERKAFMEAAKAFVPWYFPIADDIDEDDERNMGEYGEKINKLIRAYRALVESERGESGKIPGLYKLGSGE